MPAERFYTPISFEINQIVLLDGEEFHHLAHVMRMKEGQILELVNGKGSLATGKILEIEKKKASISIQNVLSSAFPEQKMILAQGIPKQPRLEYIIEKGVELGATEFWLFPAMLAERKQLSPSHLERIQHICIGALKQCGRLFLPEIKLLPPVQSWNTIPQAAFFGDVRETAPLFLEMLLTRSKDSVLIAIGPEQGFHVKEIEHMEKTLQMQGVHLHQNILRTDTAAICSLSLASSFLKKL